MLKYFKLFSILFFIQYIHVNCFCVIKSHNFHGKAQEQFTILTSQIHKLYLTNFKNQNWNKHRIILGGEQANTDQGKH